MDLVYGNANEVIKEQITEPCLVFIDGPKGDDAIKLAAELLEDERVKAVLVHDLPRSVFTRDISELVFSETFFTDDEQFVTRFSTIDANCWEVMAGTGYEPYLRKGQKTESYGHTLSAFFNNDAPVNQAAYQRYQKYLADKRVPLLRLVIGRVKSAIWLRYRRLARALKP